VELYLHSHITPLWRGAQLKKKAQEQICFYLYLKKIGCRHVEWNHVSWNRIQWRDLGSIFRFHKTGEITSFADQLSASHEGPFSVELISNTFNNSAFFFPVNPLKYLGYS
jgi:hypothetical protein